MSKKIVSFKFLLAIFLITSLKLNASTEVTLDYSFDAEIHKERDNEIFSEFSSNILGGQATSQFKLDYDIGVDYVYEHEQRIDNVLLRGDISSSYKLTPYLSWFLDIGLVELATAGNNEFDRIDTQSLIDASTGFRYSIDNLVMGQLSFTAQRNQFYYEETPLDAVEDSLEIRYVRPITRSSDLTISYSLLEQRYDEESQAISNVDNTRVRLGYRKSTPIYEFNLYLENNRIKFINQSPSNEQDVGGYGLNYTYLINSGSSLLFTYANLIQQVFQVNTDLIDTQNPLLSSGLVENNSVSLQYNLDKNDNTLSVRIYKNDLKDISQVSSSSGKQEGLIFDYTRTFNRKWSSGFRHNQLENQISDNDFQLTTVTASYQIHKSALFSSVVRFSAQEGKDNNQDIDDLILSFEITASIY